MQECDLKELYTDLNNKMFGGKLPNTVSVKWSSRMTKNAARCEYLVDYTSGVPVRTPKEIKMSKPYHKRFPEELIETMVHEMIHVKYPYDGHGKKFNKEMDRLNKKYKLNVKQFATGRAVVNYIYTCKACCGKYERGRKLENLYTYRCTCGGMLNETKI